MAVRRRLSPVKALLERDSDEATDGQRLNLRDFSSLDFELQQKLYSSGDSAVYKAQYKDGTIYAVKQRVTAELGGRADILHEAKVAVASPHLVRCLGIYFQPAHVLHMVFEWADGGDLLSVIRQRRIRGGFLPEPVLWRWAQQLFSGLSTLHCRRIIHRDVKASNILLFSSRARATAATPADDPEGYDIKLGDLGVARQLGSHKDFASTLFGTPLYMSPELLDAPTGLLANGYTVQTDMWSAGVTLYELCALASPFTGQSMAALTAAIRSGRYRPLPGSYSPEWREFVHSLLRRAPDTRPSSAAAAAQCSRWLETRHACTQVAQQQASNTAAGTAVAVGSASNALAYDDLYGPRYARAVERKVRPEKGALSPRPGERVGLPLQPAAVAGNVGPGRPSAPPLPAPQQKQIPLAEGLGGRPKIGRDFLPSDAAAKARQEARGEAKAAATQLAPEHEQDRGGGAMPLAAERLRPATAASARDPHWTYFPASGRPLGPIPEEQVVIARREQRSPGVKVIRKKAQEVEQGSRSPSPAAGVRHAVVPPGIISSPLRPPVHPPARVRVKRRGEQEPPPEPAAIGLQHAPQGGHTRVEEPRTSQVTPERGKAPRGAAQDDEASVGVGVDQRSHQQRQGERQAELSRIERCAPEAMDSVEHCRRGRLPPSKHAQIVRAQEALLEQAPPPRAALALPTLPTGVRGSKADQYAAEYEGRVAQWAAEKQVPASRGGTAVRALSDLGTSWQTMNHHKAVPVSTAPSRGIPEALQAGYAVRCVTDSPAVRTLLQANTGAAGEAGHADRAGLHAGKQAHQEMEEGEEDAATVSSDGTEEGGVVPPAQQHPVGAIGSPFRGVPSQGHSGGLPRSTTDGETLVDRIARQRQQRKEIAAARWHTELQAAGLPYK